MARERDAMSPDRLCEAAQVALQAAVEAAERSGGPWPYPADLMGSSRQPQCLCDFTRHEIEQACEFLVRLGMLEPRRPQRKHAA